ncbi:hypothetical protein LEP1GSC151_1626 [Leptospira interrogans serovar Grippotyphosa str. LT2186]|uniref:Uncharacterized protein n=1 Tax=Leptospira interrogans serovar Grippotyphosa str. LT2186 TaxID=1001599 RepID=M3FME0_LEPIR|nr:hypothetical protein LEP1GSC151_1626 [Leptospira interrogans serovar Grippotyphosa str. LT2186]
MKNEFKNNLLKIGKINNSNKNVLTQSIFLNELYSNFSIGG